MYRLVPGKKIASEKLAFLAEKISKLDSKPKLMIIQVGSDPASTLYVSKKIEAASKIGIEAEKLEFESGTDIQILKDKITKLNEDDSINGIMVQSPIPNYSAQENMEVFNLISPDKDVDGLTDTNLGRLWQLKTLADYQDTNAYFSATPAGVLDSLLWIALAEQNQESEFSEYDFNWSKKAEIVTNFLTGKTALIINRSSIVGKPLAAIMQAANTTVTIAHSRTQHLADEISRVDIVLPATGKIGLIKLANFKTSDNKKYFVDIGINASIPGVGPKGDIEFGKDNISKVNSDSGYLVGVPGGIGPLTVANLLKNTFLSYIRNN